MAIVVTAPPTGEFSGSDEPSLSTAVNQPFVSPNTLSITPVSQAVSYAPAQQSESNRLNPYLLRHNQMARTAGRQGFVSFVPIVATSAVVKTENFEAGPEEGSEVVESASELESAVNR